MDYSKYEDDNELKELLRKFYKKGQRYEKSTQRIILKDETLDLFEKVVPKVNGKRLSVEEFKNKYAKELHYKIAIMENMLDKNFLKDVNKNFKENIAIMLDRMGLPFEADEVREMTLKDFIKNAKEGKYNDVKDMYEDNKEFNLAEKITKSVEEFLKLSKEEEDVLGI